MLKKETSLGLTFGQIIAVLSLTGSMMAGWVNVKTDLATLNANQINQELRMDRHETQQKEDLRTIVVDIKESLKEIKEDIKQIRRK